MSSPITATIHQDPELQAIRNSVATKNDGNPYLLLPIRIETRFMLADTSLGGVVVFPGLLDELHKTGTNLDFSVFGKHPTPVLKQLAKINEGLTAITELAGKSGSVKSAYKTDLEQKQKSLSNAVFKISMDLERLKWDDENAFAQLRVAREQLAQNSRSAFESLKKIGFESATKYQETSSLLTHLDKIDDALEALQNRNFETKDYKEKRRTFAFVEDKMQAVSSNFQDFRDKMGVNMTATTSQIDKLDRQFTTIAPRIKQIQKQINGLQSEYKKSEYGLALEGLLKTWTELSADVGTKLAPKLELKRDLQTVDGVDVLMQIHSIYDELRKRNRTEFRKYEEVKSARESLYQKLHRLRESVHRVIEGGDESIAPIQAAWARTDKELIRFTDAVQKLQVEDRYEKAGLTRTVTHINEEYRKDLHGLLPEGSRSIHVLTNKEIEESVETYGGTISELESLLTALEKASPKQMPGVLQSIRKFDEDLSVNLRNVQILPDKKYREMVALSDKLAEKVEKINSESSKTAKARVSKGDEVRPELLAVKSIQSNIASQITDAQDRKDRFYDDERVRIVFSPVTRSQKELWVRIFPDDIAIHTHEPALTADEVLAGKAYWVENWAAGSDEELKLAAWRAIVASYGPERAAWIVKTLQPTNSASTSTSAVALHSSKLISANSSLHDVNEILAQGLRENANAFVILDKTAPLMKSAEKQLKEVSLDNENLLAKTKNLLLKTQARLGQYFGAISNLSREDQMRSRTQITAAEELQKTFSKTVSEYSNIKAVSITELIKTIAPGDLSGQPTFPNVPVKDGTWTEAPHSKVMPDRFVALAQRAGQFRYIEVGKPLPANHLVVGLDPADFGIETFSYDADGNLIVDPNIKWLTDFKTARDIGMAISFKIDQSDWDQGFDKLFVIGVKDTDASGGRDLLTSLIENHHYLPEGASVLPIGTSTNNTAESPSGFKSYDDDPANSFAVERNSENGPLPAEDPDFPSDGKRLADALGLHPSVFANLPNSQGTQISNALIFNRALFHGTIGEFMEEGTDTLFTLDNINRAKEFVSKYVAGRGFLPSLRIGEQPYGILPTTALSRFSWTADDHNLPHLSKQDFDHPALIEADLQTRFDARMKLLFQQLFYLWTSIRNNPVNPVKHNGNTSSADPQGHFMDMLGLHPNSVENFYFYGLNVAARQNSGQPGQFTVGFDIAHEYHPDHAANFFRNLIGAGYFYKSDNFYDETGNFTDPNIQAGLKQGRITSQFKDSRVYLMRHLDEENQLLGDRIDHRKLAKSLLTPSSTISGTNEEKFAAQAEFDNYVDWLTSKNAWKIHGDNQHSELRPTSISEGMPSKSLLFMLLRHSVLSSHADTMMRILEHEGLITQRLRKRLGQNKFYYARYGGSMSYVTKWTFLFSEIHALRYVLGNNMDAQNQFYAHMTAYNHGYLNRYISPEHPSYFTTFPQHNNHLPYINELQETRDAVQKLKTIPTEELDQLLSEHLDLCSYRLDSWFLGLVNKRLSQQREASPSGIFLGAYGWVEDLRKGGARTLATQLPAGLWKAGDGAVYHDADNQGFIHAPSLNHAVTAAILRAGYFSNKATSDVNNQMAVNLSSGRVRTAMNLLQGIRNGQSSGAMLGYQFERGLHEGYLHVPLELDQYIYDFREMFPLENAVDGNPTPADIARTNVVNGVGLLEYAQNHVASNGGPANVGDTLYQALKTHETTFWDALEVLNANLSSASAAKKDAILKEIDRMADAFDALGDLCISESIYQVAQGNHVRASAIFDKLSKGEMPDEVDVANIPRTGTVVTQKVAMLIDPVAPIDHPLAPSGPNHLPLDGSDIDLAVSSAAAAAPGWTSRFGPRALLEPTLNKWVGEMIGDPANIKCLTEFMADGLTTYNTVTLADLNVQPLDVLHLFGTGPINGGAELNTLIANWVRAQIVSLPIAFQGNEDDVEVTINYTQRDPSWSANEFSFYEKAAYIQSLRELVTNSNVLAADHLHIPGEQEVSPEILRNQDLDELMVRITNGVARLGLLRDDYENFFTNNVDPTNYLNHSFINGEVDSLRDLLTEAADFGIPGTRNEVAVSYGDAAGRILMGAAIGTFKAIADRLERVIPEMEMATDTAKSKDARVESLVEVGKILIGPEFRVWPQFTLRNGTELNDQLSLPGNKGLLRSASDFALDEWSQSVARVRERMQAVDTLEMHATVFASELGTPSPLQLPFETDGSGTSVDHWLGIEYPSGYKPGEDKLSIVLYRPQVLNTSPNTAKVGILIDEWVEIIPSEEETTGLTFNYDQPDAKAPNTVLLAVTPKETGTWDWDDLVVTLVDTLELAKNRAVEPEHLESSVVGQILPGLMFEVVPPTTGEVTPQDDSNALGWQVITNLKANNDNVDQ
jgi:hypothetical protein